MNFSVDLFDICDPSVHPAQECNAKGMSYMGERSFFSFSLINILKLEGMGQSDDGCVQRSLRSLRGQGVT